MRISISTFHPRRLSACIAVVTTCLMSQASVAGQDTAWLDAYRAPASRIIGEALSGTFAWQRLAELSDTFGHRLSGSPQLERAIRWAAEEMRRDGLENVRLEPVMVPHWVRGREAARVVRPVEQELVMLGLGGSIGTPAAGVEAETLVVGSFDELDARASDVAGKIVVYNVPFTTDFQTPFATYLQTVRYRMTGASRAARHGAVASLVRSVGPRGHRTPHTGSVTYTDSDPQIPAAAVTVEDAELLQRLQDRGTPATVQLTMEARMLPDAESANVVAEILGRERPEEVVVVGGHIDSWDVGTGSTDDGGGCIVTWDALRILKKLGLRPRRTLRVVLWTNEENGLGGGLAYRDRYADELDNHVMMLESDSGVFQPRGFGFTGNPQARATIETIASLLRGIDADRIGPTGNGADIGPSVRAANIPSLSLDVDGASYFTIHHTPADTMDKIDPTDVARNVAAVAVMAYVIADMPQRLGR